MSHDHSQEGPAPHLQHHFDSSEHQFDAAKLGMWLFLAQEILFFGGLFCAYTIYRSSYPEAWVYGHHALSKFWGALNTVILLVSSLTMALAVRCAQLSRTRGLLINLGLTFLCATGFMVVKGVEYYQKWEKGYLFAKKFDYIKLDARLEEEYREEARALGIELSHEKVAEAATSDGGGPAVDEDPDKPKIDAAAVGPTGVVEVAEMGHGSEVGHDLHGPRPPNVHLFFGIYFALTGLHGIYVLAGMVMLIWLAWGAAKGRYNKNYFTPVDLGGLYWHLVDLVWIYLFPLLYLIG